MSAFLIALIGSIVIPLLLGLITYMQWRENHGDRLRSKMDAVIKSVVSDETKPLASSITDHTARLGQLVDHLGRIEGLIKDVSTSQRKTSDEMIEVRTRLTMFGSAVEQLAMNAAKNLHQPNPLRAHVDHLLEAFMEGTLTPEERIELRKVLVKIRNFEPSGEPLEFPVYPGEQTAAAILLSTMDIVAPGRMASMGHAVHRNHSSGTEGDS